ncbi:MAG TPA: hypothetical protein VFO04_07320, partial [Nitrospira sp.]|nr:hypothetical protein [Nitrospira sp.]
RQMRVSDQLPVSIEESVVGILEGEPLSAEAIETKIAERLEARKRKDFAKADEIRKSLAAQGIIIEDKPDGTSRWKR